MFETFELLAKLRGIKAVVKLHTRTKKEERLYDSLPLPNVSDVSSVELCSWADVVLVIGSSIIVEALTRGKPALYLKYLHENTTIYEEFGACWTIHNEDELQDALLSLQLSKKDVPYSNENVNRFLSEIIYGDRNEEEVLTGYGQFIVNCVKG
jgi:UDP-N-acetylglucosamine:LPS N-acetylglucosamine transferase